MDTFTIFQIKASVGTDGLCLTRCDGHIEIVLTDKSQVARCRVPIFVGGITVLGLLPDDGAVAPIHQYSVSRLVEENKGFASKGKLGHVQMLLRRKLCCSQSPVDIVEREEPLAGAVSLQFVHRLAVLLEQAVAPPFRVHRLRIGMLVVGASSWNQVIERKTFFCFLLCSCL